MRKQTDHRQQIHKDYDVLARRKESSILVGLPFLYVLTNNNFNKLKNIHRRAEEGYYINTTQI